MTTAILIVNYNMPERTDALVEHIQQHVTCPYELMVIDNGSDQVYPSKYTRIYLSKNIQTTGGWLAGLEFARRFKPFAYWFLITSAEFPAGAAKDHSRWQGDPLSPMVHLLEENIDAVGVHPALTPDSTSAWKHLFTRGGDQPRPTWMIDNIASLYRSDWFDKIGWFDPDMTFAWGIDMETCWKARSQGRTLWVDERVMVKKVTNIGYKLDRMGMSADQRVRLAGENMTRVLSNKYGPEWNWKMRKEFVTSEML
jgi:hypothetical protein